LSISIKKKKIIDDKRPLPPNTMRSIRESILLDWTYNSNAIEGNTLTLSETKVVLEGITIGGKTLKEHLEAINHKEAILYLEDIVKHNEDFSEWQIKNIHRLILKGIDDVNAGMYRKENVLISGATHTPPDYLLVQEQMADLLRWYHGEGQNLHVTERAALLHVIFVKIHPFLDGNGRIARLLLNLELMKNGYPPIVIRKEERIDYYNALDKAHTTNEFRDFLELGAAKY
jgi:Fic family protein